MSRERLLFIAPWFLFPVDSGGKIRTTDLLRGLKGGSFHITLASPVPPGGERRHAADLDSVCDRFVGWPAPPQGRLHRAWRLRHLLSRLPLPVAADRSAAARCLVARELAAEPDIAVFDFTHSEVLAPPVLPVPAVLFTHNVEAEIFERHAAVARTPWHRLVWRAQHAKMVRFEGRALRRFDRVVAVSGRDAAILAGTYGLDTVRTIPSGIDTDRYGYRPPSGEAGGPARIVFTATMGSPANADAIAWLMDAVWPRLAEAEPRAALDLVGRDPPAGLVDRARRRGLPWTFTGFVPDVRPFVHRARAFVVPLRVGGGTRLKVLEAMAMGCPIVSTSIGVEGLGLEPGIHYLHADEPDGFAHALARLLKDGGLAARLSQAAREHVERFHTATAVAQAFEAICREAILAPLPQKAL